LKTYFQDAFSDSVWENLTLDIASSKISHNMSVEASNGTDETIEQVKKA